MVQTICVIDDDPTIATLVGRMAARTGLRVLVSTSAVEALALAAHERFDLIVADVIMPEVTGPEFAHELRERGMNCPILFISGDSSLPTLDSALQVAGASFLPKPFTADELTDAIWAALRQRVA